MYETNTTKIHAARLKQALDHFDTLEQKTLEHALRVPYWDQAELREMSPMFREQIRFLNGLRRAHEHKNCPGAHLESLLKKCHSKSTSESCSE